MRKKCKKCHQETLPSLTGSRHQRQKGLHNSNGWERNPSLAGIGAPNKPSLYFITFFTQLPCPTPFPSLRTPCAPLHHCLAVSKVQLRLWTRKLSPRLDILEPRHNSADIRVETITGGIVAEGAPTNNAHKEASAGSKDSCPRNHRWTMLSLSLSLSSKLTTKINPNPNAIVILRKIVKRVSAAIQSNNMFHLLSIKLHR